MEAINKGDHFEGDGALQTDRCVERGQLEDRLAAAHRNCGDLQARLSAASAADFSYRPRDQAYERNRDQVNN